jgi:hypothetical protein
VFKTVKPCRARVCRAVTSCRAPERAARAAPRRPRRTQAETACDHRVRVRAVLASASRADSEAVPRPGGRAGHAARLSARDTDPLSHPTSYRRSYGEVPFVAKAGGRPGFKAAVSRPRLYLARSHPRRATSSSVVAVLKVATHETSSSAVSKAIRKPRSLTHVSFHHQRLLRCGRRRAGTATTAIAAAGLHRPTSLAAFTPRLRPQIEPR